MQLSKLNLKNNFFSYIIIFFPNFLFSYWVFLDKSLPGSDSANFIEVSLRKFQIIKNSNDIVSIFQALYLYRDWKPISFSNFIIPFLFTFDNLEISIQIFQIILYFIFTIILFRSLQLVVDKLIASIITNLIILNPYFFNLATEFYADFLSIILTYLSLFLFVRAIYEKKEKYIWFSAFALATSITLRPVETLFYTVVSFLLYCLFYNKLLISSNFYLSKRFLFIIFSFILNFILLFFLFFYGNQFRPISIFYISLFFLLLQMFLLKQIFNIKSIFLSGFSCLTLSISISLIWFAPFIPQTWNWIFYTSIGNRIFQSDQSFKERELLDVLNEIFNQFYNTKILLFILLAMIISLILLHHKNFTYFKNFFTIFISLLIFFSFFIFIYIYSGTADPRRLSFLLLLFTIFFFILIHYVFSRKYFLVFLLLLLSFYVVNSLTFTSESYFYNYKFLFSNNIKKPFTSEDPNLNTYMKLSKYSFEEGSKIAWLSSNAVSIGDDKYILDPAIIRMLYVKNKKDILFWYTVSSNVDGYISNLRSENYNYILVDISLPPTEPPTSNFFMNSNFHIIKSFLNIDLTDLGIIKLNNLKISNSDLILYKINY